MSHMLDQNTRVRLRWTESLVLRIPLLLVPHARRRTGLTSPVARLRSARPGDAYRVANASVSNRAAIPRVKRHADAGSPLR